MQGTWNKRIIDIFPRCGYRREDSKHILECKAEIVVLIWMQELEGSESRLIAKGTCPDIRVAINEGRKSWKLDQTMDQHSSLHQWPSHPN